MKRTKKTYKQSTVNVIVFVLVLVLLLYIGVQLSRSFYSSVSTQRTQVITDVDYLHLKGYVFRYETPIMGQSNGIYDCAAADGTRIGVGKSYATFYPTVDAYSKQKKLDELSEQILRLDSKLASGGTISQLSDIKRTVSSSYYAFINNVQNGNFSAADSLGEVLANALINYDSLTGGWENTGAAAKEKLESEKNSLLASCGSGRELVADQSFYFFRETDGYEGVFDPEKLDGISFDGLKKLIASKGVSYGNDVIGKRVNSTEWFLVIPTDEETVMRFASTVNVGSPDTEDSQGDLDETAEQNGADENGADENGEMTVFNIGTSYSITFSSMGDRKSAMVLDNAYIDDKGDGYLVFSGFDMALASELSRAQDVKIDMGSKTGYRIPTDALDEVDGELGVYILTGTVVEFRRVTEKVEDLGNGYCLVNTYEEDKAELDAAEEKGETRVRPPYLNENDLIITSGNDLYDGKLIG